MKGEVEILAIFSLLSQVLGMMSQHSDLSLDLNILLT